jgi:hypothetical protein
MHHMSRIVLTICLLAGSLGACGRPQVTLDGRPAAAGHRRGPLPLTPTSEAAVDLDADPDLAVGRRALLIRNAAAIEGRSLSGDAPKDERAMLATLLGDLALTSVPAGRDAAVEDWLAAARPRRGTPRVGDLAVFKATGDGVPRVAVVVERHRDGLVEAVCASRAAWRRIRLHPERRSVRRDDGRILNTFIRIRRTDDPPRQQYLAGQLLEGFYTLLD